MSMDSIRIGSHLIGPGHPPYVVAEMSGNHNQSLDRAIAIVDAAADAGVHAIKLQTYTPDTMTLDLSGGLFSIDDADSLWDGETLYGLYQKASTPWEWHRALFDRARERALTIFSTPFDPSAVELLESLGAPAYKIASFEIVDLQLIECAARTGKPLLVSTGMATLSEIEDAVETARAAGCRDLILLKCTSAYPAGAASANLRTVPHLAELFGVQVGLSDHTLGTAVAVAAVSLGATVIEKHFTLRRADGGVDAAFSLEPPEMAALVRDTALAAEALGSVRYGTGEDEVASRRFRRSLYIVRDLEAGGTLTRQNVRAVRPGDGLPPKYLEVLLGRKVQGPVKKGTPVAWTLLQ